MGNLSANSLQKKVKSSLAFDDQNDPNFDTFLGHIPLFHFLGVGGRNDPYFCPFFRQFKGAKNVKSSLAFDNRNDPNLCPFFGHLFGEKK